MTEIIIYMTIQTILCAIAVGLTWQKATTMRDERDAALRLAAETALGNAEAAVMVDKAMDVVTQVIEELE